MGAKASIFAGALKRKDLENYRYVEQEAGQNSPDHLYEEVNDTICHPNGLLETSL